PVVVDRLCAACIVAGRAGEYSFCRQRWRSRPVWLDLAAGVFAVWKAAWPRTGAWCFCYTGSVDCNAVLTRRTDVAPLHADFTARRAVACYSCGCDSHQLRRTGFCVRGVPDLSFAGIAAQA